MRPAVRLFMIVTVVLLSVAACTTHVGEVTGFASDNGVNPSFYTVLRWFVCWAAGWWALRAYRMRDWTVLGAAAAVLIVFNPLWHPPLTRFWWEWIDAVVAALLAFATYAQSDDQREMVTRIR